MLVKRRRLSSEFYEQRHREKVLAHALERLSQESGISNIPEVAKGLQSFLRLEEERIRVADRLGATGEWTARARTFVIDVLIGSVLRHANSIVANKEGERLGRLSILALGGYGRNELSPFSDLDLLFLYSGRLSKQTGQVIERCLHLLWDAGLNVGQKSFAVEECISSARRDPHFQTALVTVRLVAGEVSLAERLQGRLERERLKNGTALIETVQRERDERYQKRTGVIYLQEPNVKESAGGLRDLHSALWAAYARYGCRTLAELRVQELIDNQQHDLATQSYNFLLRLRHHAHWITGRKTDHFALDLQETLAQKLGYVGSAHLQPSELLMRNYYRHARELHQFSDLLFARATERPDSGRRWFVRSKREELDEQFSIVDGKIILDPKGKLNAPFLFFQALAHAQTTGAIFSPALRDEIRRNLGLIDRAFRNTQKAAQAFLSILRQPGRVASALRLMHETEVLGRYLPEFGRISFLIQHDLYHHYTVDEHTLRTIEALDDLHNSNDPQRAPLRSALAEVEDVALLYLALLLHDLGKGRGRGHIPRGARIAEPICQRLHLDSESTKKIIQLVRQHVYMAHVSQRRDLGEHRLSAAFASEVGSLDLLNMLYVLTYADLNGVGPGVWSEWKGNLLHELYNLARGFLAGGNELEPSDQVALVKNQVIESLLGKVPVSVIERHFALLPSRYTRVATSEIVATHLALIAELDNKDLACSWREWGGGATELTICARDRRGLFAHLAGALAANGVEILSADVNTREDGIAIDTFILREAATRRAVDRRRWSGLQRSLTASVLGQHDIAALVERWRTRHAPRRKKSFIPVNHSELQIVCNNDIAEATTVVEVRAPDETGLAFKIANALTSFGLDIVCARIAGEKSDALDVFYVTDASGSKLTETRIMELENVLKRRLSAV